jgi:hypothetical protein
MCILKNSKERLENLKSRGFFFFSKIDSIKTNGFPTFYTIPNNKLKSRLFHIIDHCFSSPELKAFK